MKVKTISISLYKKSILHSKFFEKIKIKKYSPRGLFGRGSLLRGKKNKLRFQPIEYISPRKRLSNQNRQNQFDFIYSQSDICYWLP